MSIFTRVGARISAWLSAWQYVLILGALLCGSLWLNLHQYGIRRAAVEKARADVLADTLKVTAGIARDKTRDDGELYVALSDLLTRYDARVRNYRDAATKHPLPANCAPGKARMDAVNAGVPTGATP